ncbi:MAG TPA: hypothetical protein PKW95_19375 [bacterium]|nr:hypothetical protein [bacterium]
MTKKFLLMALILSFVFVLSGLAFAQEDDDAADDDDDDAADDDDDATFDDSTVEFTSPSALEANTPYEFQFQVFNAAAAASDKGEWIKQVDMVLPDGYLVDDTNLEGPACLHPGDYCDGSWDVQFDATSATITWQSFGIVTTEEYGDIREQDVQTFTFNATTDEGPTDGFNWILTGDEGSVVSGTAYIGGADDDDITPDDDTDNGGNDDDDDDDGCGC